MRVFIGLSFARNVRDFLCISSRKSTIAYSVTTAARLRGSILGCKASCLRFLLLGALHDAIAQTRPDYVLILPWNLHTEVTAQLAQIRNWGGKFVTAVPELRID